MLEDRREILKKYRDATSGRFKVMSTTDIIRYNQLEIDP